MNNALVGFWLSALGMVCAGLTPPLGLAGEEGPNGLVVEEVAKGSAAEKAGIRPGDRLLSWSRPALGAGEPALEGPLEQPFDLVEVEIEQAPRVSVTLAGMQAGSPAQWTLPPVPFDLMVRPQLPDDVLARYQAGNEQLREKKVKEAAEQWRLAAAAVQPRQAAVAVWLLTRVAKVLADARLWPDTDVAFAEAIRTAEGTLQPPVVAQILRGWGKSFERRRDPAKSEEYYRRALALDETRGHDSLALAHDLGGLGIAAWGRRDVPASEGFHRRALAIRERLAPGSLDLGSTFNNLGNTALSRGDLAFAEECYRRFQVITERLAPESLEAGAALNNLGIVAWNREDYAAAESYHRRALAIREKVAPGSFDVAVSLNNLGNTKMRQSDPAGAEQHYRRVLEIMEGLAPGSVLVAMSLNNLGTVLSSRKEWAAARDHFERSLAIKQSLAPDSLEVAGTWHNIGDMERGRGDPAAAAEPYRRALSIRERIAPGSSDEAETLHALGLVEREESHADAAGAFFLKALASLESQKARIGGTQEARSGFGAGHADYYQDAIQSLLELGRTAEALHVVERSRARSFLSLLAERELLLGTELPADLVQERTRTDAEYDRTQAALARLGAVKDSEQIEKLVATLRELREKQEGIASQIRKASPHFASLQDPQPLDLAGVRAALDPGTALLAYAVGSDATVLFVVQPAAEGGPGLAVHRLAIGEKALREKVEAFRGAIQRRRPAESHALRAQAAELYDLLVAPAEGELTSSARLLISPDGPLHSLPLGALVRPSGSYLVEWKPFHTVASATVYAELKRSRHGRAPDAALVAFGDPQYPSARPPEQVHNSELRSTLTRGFSLARLPSTREEVLTIASLFPGHVQAYLGAQATEERAKSLGTQARYVHFACHGYLDERFPLNSALALTMPESPQPGEENGLLQAWEIFEKVRLDADLVVLSACQTALGKEMGGEGLLGLARAFHYAGARSVLGSLWDVSDQSTALLMKRFYGYLKGGRADEALRSAQLDLLHTRPAPGAQRRDLSQPYHWAGFQLSGDAQ